MVNLKKQTKYCKSCGLVFHNRKKWQSRGLWESIAQNVVALIKAQKT